jgi:hypothetical protein
VSDARDPGPTAGRLPPSMGRWGMRGMEDLTGEALARLHQQLDGWIRQRAHDPARPQRRPWTYGRERGIRPNTLYLIEEKGVIASTCAFVVSNSLLGRFPKSAGTGTFTLRWSREKRLVR